ncbi:MAG: hypothetical protein LBU65_06290 [Planctomycetaceae bacterium]|jgi:hypothetical protein|nr:hypothetical protein [Planctomycetaceae bacterium]
MNSQAHIPNYNSDTNIDSYDLLEQFLVLDVTSSFGCRRLLRVIQYIQLGIPLFLEWREEISNGFYITLEKEYAVIGLFDENYLACQLDSSPVNRIPYPVFTRILYDRMEVLEQKELKNALDPNDPFIGKCVYGNVKVCDYEHFILEYESKDIFLHKTDVFWELHYVSCKNYVHIGDKVFVKIVDKQANGIYVGSMTAAKPDYNPLLEPNLVRGAIWQGTIVKNKRKRDIIEYCVDIFPCCWGVFFDNAKHHHNRTINTRILDIQTIISYSKYSFCCKLDLQIVGDCGKEIVNKQHRESLYGVIAHEF